MKVAIAQITPFLGDIKKNYELHLKYIEKARKRKADILIFPELSLTGYSLQDLVEEVALIPEKNSYFKDFIALSREISIICGFIEEKERGLFYNSAAYFSGGKILHIHRKVFLPTFGIFEEAKFYAQGKNFTTFNTTFGKAGMMICRDFLSYSASYLLFAGGTEIVFVISAAPGRGVTKDDGFDTSHLWELMGETISLFSSVYLIYCNRTGFEDGKVFAGGSFIFGPGGDLKAKASYFHDDFLVYDIDLNEIREVRKKWFYKRDDKPEIILEALKRIVKGYED